MQYIFHSGGPLFIETRDHTRLFFKEWGAGEPILFVHCWGP